MEISEVTGLPELPKGYFWRIKPVYDDRDKLFVGVRLAIMKRRKGRFPLKVRHTNHFISSTSSDHMRRLLLQEAKALHGWFTGSIEVLGFMGDYPPRNINN